MGAGVGAGFGGGQGDFGDGVPLFAVGALADPFGEFVAAVATHKDGGGFGHELSLPCGKLWKT